jgi:hypothetical protein
MRLSSGRAKILESFVGIVILVLLIATAVGVYMVQRDVNMARFGVGPSAEESTVAKGEFNLSSAGTAEFPATGSSETYNTDNLYEKIDGKAPMYQESGFVSLITQRFANKGNAELGLELYLYDMGNVRNAFSVYSRQKRADVVDMNDVPMGYKTSNAIYLATGKFYIEMVGFAESQELIEAMRGIAKKLIAQLPVDEKDEIKELNYFPPGTVAGSWKLNLSNAFGFDGLSNTYSAQYKVNDKTVTIFFSKCVNADEARKIAKSYNDFLIDNDAKTVPPDPNNPFLKAASALSILSFYGSTEIVFFTGPFVGGIHEADDSQSALKAAEVLMEQLEKVND